MKSIIMIITMVFIFACGGKNIITVNGEKGYMTIYNIRIYETPMLKKSIGMVYHEEKVHILKQRRDCVLIKTAKSQGWIESKFFDKAALLKMQKTSSTRTTFNKLCKEKKDLVKSAKGAKP